jgi:hypothetical protein
MHIGSVSKSNNTSGCLDFEMNSQDNLRQLRLTTNRIADAEKAGLLEESELDAP